MKSSAGACGISVCFCFVLLTATTARGAEYIFPQVADGSSGSLAYVTTFLINNVRSSSNTVTISFFQGGLSNPDNGQPWILDLRSNDRSASPGATPL